MRTRTLWSSLIVGWLAVLCIGVFRWWGPQIHWPTRDRITTTTWRTNEVYVTNIVQVTLVTNYIESPITMTYHRNSTLYATNLIFPNIYTTNYLYLGATNTAGVVIFTNGIVTL